MGPLSYRILLVDDDEDDYVVARDLLSESERVSFQLDWVSSFEQAAETLEQEQHDVYLFDYRLEARNGLELLQLALERGCQKPIILLTGLGDHDIDMAAIQMGAEDYLVKGQINTPLLERSILHAIERKRSEARQSQLLAELEEANRELMDFAYIISHDLKAPLRGIGSLVNWIATDQAHYFDDEAKELLDLLTKRIKRMWDLIDGVLRYSRVGRIREQWLPVNLNEIVAHILDTIELPPPVQVVIESPLPTVYGEEVRLRQVLQNLISNAVNYIDKPQGQIRIGCEESEEQWTIWIQDNGVGIEPAHHHRIFQIFQTLSSFEESGSTGVGLTIVKKIVEMYGGTVWVKSQPQQGSTFYFTLPKQATQPQPDLRRAS